MIILELTKEKEQAWDKYVKNHKQSSFYHQIGWKNIVEKTYKHKPVYLIAEENNVIKGVFPLFLMKNIIFGKKLVSLPFGSYGGIISDNENIEKFLINKAKNITNNYQLDYLEIRNYHKKQNNLLTNEVYFSLIMKLNANPEITWKEQLNTKVRNATRKSLKAGLVFDMNNDYIHDFYRLFSKSMNSFGTPVHSLSFFNNLLLEFPETVKVFVVKKENKVLAALIALSHKDYLISGWESSDRKYSKFNPNNLLYWEVIKYGCENGFKYFDFGRSINDSGTFKFKKPWGAIPHQLYYQYYLNRASKIPDTSQASQKRKKFTKYWKTLPFFITNQIGPYLRKNLP